MIKRTWWDRVILGKKEIPAYENESILRQIYDEYNLHTSEGAFHPKSWLRPYDLLNDGTENDQVITNFAGMSVTFDIVTHEYELALPIKFNASFKYWVKAFIAARYDVTEFKDTGYTAVIYLKEKTI